MRGVCVCVGGALGRVGDAVWSPGSISAVCPSGPALVRRRLREHQGTSAHHHHQHLPGALAAGSSAPLRRCPELPGGGAPLPPVLYLWSPCRILVTFPSSPEAATILPSFPNPAFPQIPSLTLRSPALPYRLSIPDAISEDASGEDDTRRQQPRGARSALHTYGRDLTRDAELGALDPLIGREVSP